MRTIFISAVTGLLLVLVFTAKDKLVEFECKDDFDIVLVGQISEFHFLKFHWDGDFSTKLNIAGTQLYLPIGVKRGIGNQSEWTFLRNWKTKRHIGKLASATKSIILVEPKYTGQCVFTN